MEPFLREAKKIKLFDCFNGGVIDCEVMCLPFVELYGKSYM